MKFIFTALFVFTFFSQGFGQKTITRNEQLWLQYYNQIKLSDKFSLLSDFGVRTKTGVSNWYQITSRIGLNYNINKSIKGVSGFALFTTFKENIASTIELRPYQEFNITNQIGKIKIQNRLRLEYRNFNTNGISSNNFRLRYRLFCTYPLMSLSKNKPDSKLLLNFGDELFINFGKSIIYNTLDNNRLLLGLGFQFNNALTCSITYNYQYGRRGKQLYEQSDILWITVNHKIGFKN